nr:expressed conserved protein [Hymenolepis microstoma]
MTCHRRLTYTFVTLFSLIALVVIAFEVFSPTMLKKGAGCYGIVFDCDTCPTIKTVASINKCPFSFNQHNDDPFFVASLVTASVALGIVLIMTIIAIILACKLCCGHSTWPTSISRFVVAYLVFAIFAIAANVTAMALWIRIKDNLEFMSSFWAGWAANGVLLLLLVLLIALRACKVDEKEQHQEPSQPLFRSLYSMTASVVMNSKK